MALTETDFDSYHSHFFKFIINDKKINYFSIEGNIWRKRNGLYVKDKSNIKTI